MIGTYLFDMIFFVLFFLGCTNDEDKMTEDYEQEKWIEEWRKRK